MHVGAADDPAEREAAAVASNVVAALATDRSASERVFAATTSRIRPAQPGGAGPVTHARPLGHDGGPGSTPTIRREWRTEQVQIWQSQLNAGDLGKKYGGTSTIHHHVSRQKMSEIVISFGKATSGDRNLRMAATSFKQAVDVCVQQTLKLQRLPFDTALENLPFNLHYGPQKVIGNPGSAFDATTEEGAGGARIESAMSALLRTFQSTYDQGFSDDGEALNTATWKRMTELLNDAKVLYQQGAGGLETSQEQWILVDEDDNIWIKKGLLGLRDVETCALRFNKQDLYRGVESNGALGHVECSLTQNFPLADGTAADVTIFVTGERLDHFCNRHTFKYFDFDDVKGVNIFWPPGTDRAALRGFALGRLQDMLDVAIRACDAATAPDFATFNQEFSRVTGGRGLKTVTADGGVYFAAEEADDPPAALPGDLLISVDMFAPTGPQYDAFEKATLEPFGRDGLDRIAER